MYEKGKRIEFLDLKKLLFSGIFLSGIGGYPPPPLCFGRRTISFLVEFESSALCTLKAYIGLLGYFIPHFMNNKADYGFTVLKKCTSKTEKMRKCPKTTNFGHVFVY